MNLCIFTRSFQAIRHLSLLKFHHAIFNAQFLKNHKQIDFFLSISVMACDQKFMAILKGIDSEYPSSHAERVLKILEQKVSF